MYITCLSKMLIETQCVKMTVCDGEPELLRSHCRWCEYYRKNKENEMNEDEED